jgi:hypothetical protein
MIHLPFQSEMNTWDAAMIKILDFNNKPIVKYCDDIASGLRTPGIMIWPVEFDIF